MRTTRELREKMELAAERSGRSLAQEVEWRLEQSVSDEESEYDKFGGKDYHRLGLLLVSAIHECEIISKKRWYETPKTIDATASFLVGILDGVGRGWAEGPGETVKIGSSERLKDFRKRVKTRTDDPSASTDD